MHVFHGGAISSGSTAIEIIPKRFVFSVERGTPKNTPNCFYFTVDHDDQFAYQPFYADFGPLSLLQIHIFLIVALTHMNEHECVVHFYCNHLPQNVANSVLLAACFRLIHMKLPSDEALRPFAGMLARLKPYRDASSFPSTYDLTVAACVKGIEKAMKNGWYDPNTFEPQAWADRELVENGDMNWLIPNKLLAFASPYNTNEVQGYRVCTPTDIVPVFRELGITNIVRLNNKTYDEQIFKDAGFTHTEMFFPDGTCPPEPILVRFLELIEGPDVVALHCKAGLGRTGTLAGCYLIKDFDFTAAEAIGWIRVCRPGSVIGPQQQYLVKYWNRLHQQRPVTNARRTPRLSRPNEMKPRTAGGLKKTAKMAETKHTLSRVEQPQGTAGLQIQAVALTPQVPQPRKLQRAQGNSRRTPRKH